MKKILGNIRLIKELMKKLDVSSEELEVYDMDILTSGNLPLEILYDDGTKSSDIREYIIEDYDYPIGEKKPSGVVIEEMLFAFVTSYDCVDDILEDLGEDFFHPLQVEANVPSKKEMDILKYNLESYQKTLSYIRGTKSDYSKFLISVEDGYALYDLKSGYIEENISGKISFIAVGKL